MPQNCLTYFLENAPVKRIWPLLNIIVSKLKGLKFIICWNGWSP